MIVRHGRRLRACLEDHDGSYRGCLDDFEVPKMMKRFAAMGSKKLLEVLLAPTLGGEPMGKSL